MGIIYNSLTPTEGLVLSLDSANRRSYPGSGNTWFDLSGNNNHGALIGGVSYNGFAMNLDGVNDYIDTNYIPGVVSAITISAWFLKTGSTRAYFLASSGSQGIGFELYETVAYINAYGNNANQYAQFNWNEGGWHHWAMVYDGTQAGNSNRLKVYVDGIQQVMTFSGTIQPTINASSTSFRIGQRPWSVSYANHSFDDGRIYNRALSLAEISTLFNSKRRRYGL